MGIRRQLLCFGLFFVCFFPAGVGGDVPKYPTVNIIPFTDKAQEGYFIVVKT